MRKFILEIVKIASFILFYKLVMSLFSNLLTLLLDLLLTVPAISGLIAVYYDGLLYTLLPAACVITVCSLMMFLYKDGLHAISLILCLAFLSYLTADKILSAADSSGILSLDFAIQLWFSIILAGGFLYYLCNMTIAYYKKKSDTTDPDKNITIKNITTDQPLKEIKFNEKIATIILLILMVLIFGIIVPLIIEKNYEKKHGRQNTALPVQTITGNYAGC